MAQKITINDIQLEVNRGVTILQAARANNIYIPTLCEDPRLEPYGGCRLCIVEVEGMPRPATACTTPVTKGMVVKTSTPYIEKLRKTIIEFMLSDHPNDCMVCQKTGDCRLQDLAYQYNANGNRFVGMRRNFPIVDDNPFIRFEPNKCVLCGKCTSICQDLVKTGTIEMTGRGFHSKPDTAFSRPRTPENCQFCGQCISVCPVGALTERPSFGQGRKHEMTLARTTCSYCGTGCNFYLNVKDEKVVKVTSDYDAIVNKGNLCVKGRFGYEFIHHPDRLTTPLIREGDKFREASWDEALDLVSSRFKELIRKYGNDSVGALSSSRCTNEENFLVGKFARAVLGTNNVDNCARV
jgi:formate dehydrogenase alpha subunit